MTPPATTPLTGESGVSFNRSTLSRGLGPLERAIINHTSNGHRTFRLSEVARAIGATPWATRHALARLERRGYVRRIGWGRYELVIDPVLLGGQQNRVMETQGTRGAPARSSHSVSAPDPPARSSYPWFGPVERQVLVYVFSSGLERFTLRELVEALLPKLSRSPRPDPSEVLALERRLWQALQNLRRRGVVRKDPLRRGWYELAARPGELGWLLSMPVRPRSADPPTPARGLAEAWRFGARGRSHRPYFDNVRGYTISGKYVGGDRGRTLTYADMVRFDGGRVSYLEAGVVIGNIPAREFLGGLHVYTNRAQDGYYTMRAEWRPPRGYVKRYGPVAVAEDKWYIFDIVGYELLRSSLESEESPPGARELGMDLVESLARMLGRERIARLAREVGLAVVPRAEVAGP